MTPEQQRIAIAEASGWSNIHQAENGDGNTLMGWWSGPPRTSLVIPAYPTELNAMRVALQAQTQAFRAEFDRLLHALAEEKHLLIIELTAQDWADTFIEVFESLDLSSTTVL